MVFRRRHHTQTRGKRSLGFKLILCFVIAAGIAFLIGLILNATLDEETYYRLTTKPKEKVSETILYKSSIPDITADAFSLNGKTADTAGKSAVAITLNRADGTYLYSSEVLSFFGKSSDKPRIDYALSDIRGYHVYVSGIFYAQAPAREGVTYFAAEEEERAAVREFFADGGNDLVLRGLDFSDGAIEETLAYIKAIKLAAGENGIGVAIRSKKLLDTEDWSPVDRVLQVCDFCVLDLSDAEGEEKLDEYLARFSYSYRQYGMRLLFDKGQTDWIGDAKELGILNYEVGE